MVIATAAVSVACVRAGLAIVSTGGRLRSAAKAAAVVQ
jgi:hypothetical protein